jgi:hypothetical protein
MRKKVEKWQEPPPAKQVKVLPAPDMEPKKRRGGRRYRKMKERYGANRDNLCNGSSQMDTCVTLYRCKIIGGPQDSNTDPIAQHHPLVRAVGVKINKHIGQRGGLCMPPQSLIVS